MKFLCKIGFHKFKIKKSAGVWNYLCCIHCKERKIDKKQQYSGYSAIDRKWLNAG